MRVLIALSVLLALTRANRRCDGTCVQGEGDCDRDKDCLPGLKCKFDWWFGTDHCVAGPTTKNFTWTDWGDWTKCIGSFCGAGQVGIRTRSRDCVPPVDGGFPCPSETDEEQEACDMPECPYTDWEDWTSCRGDFCGAGEVGSRTRTRNCIPADDGQFACPEATDEEEGSCDMPECPYTEWGDWTKCMGDLCGEGQVGTKTRTRDCIPADDGQFACPEATEEEEGSCDMPACPYTEWGDWTKCTGEFCGAGQVGLRTRTRDCIPADDGQFACPEATDEEEGSCDMPECPFTEWGDWTKCTGEFCGSGEIGSRTRTRECIPADDGQFACQEATDEEEGSCDMPECPYTEWGDWTKCMGDFCGEGQVGSKTRTRDCIPADDGQFACPEATDEEEGSCDMPACPYTEWGDWTVCNGEFCGAGEIGSRTRTRECIPADDGQFACQEATDEEEGSCDMPECPFTEWGEWSVCSGELCDGPGTNTRTRDCIPADDGSFGCPVPNEEEQGNCDMPACDWTDWGVWSECGGAGCGETGTMSRARDCVPAADGSYGCPVPNEEEQDSCNMPDCNCFCPAP